MPAITIVDVDDVLLDCGGLIINYLFMSLSFDLFYL